MMIREELNIICKVCVETEFDITFPEDESQGTNWNSSITFETNR